MKLQGFLALLLLLTPSCSSKQDALLEPLPALEAQEIQNTPFIPDQAWKNSPKDWSIIQDALRVQLQIPEALETKLKRDDRESWKNALKHLEQSQSERKDALMIANLQIEQTNACDPPGSAFSLQQRAQIQLTLQLHRNVLWRLGRLEMASRGILNARKKYLSLFSGGGIKDADKFILTPMNDLADQIAMMRQNQVIPKGDWKPGTLHNRAARTSHPEAIFMLEQSMLETWRNQMKLSTRWEYLSESADTLIEAHETWNAEFDELVRAYRALAFNIKTLEHDFAPPHALIAWPCVNHNLKQMRIVSELYSHILPMQWAMTKAQFEARHTLERLKSSDYNGSKRDFLIHEVESLLTQLDAQKAKLSRAEDILLITWDEIGKVIWGGLPDFIDPIHHHSQPAVESPEKWVMFYQNIKQELAGLAVHPEPEPEQPTKRGKATQAYISTILETLHAPSRIDEGEKSLLAISELESHMVSIRDELLRLCKQGACQSFPEAELAHSPRQSAWVVMWRQSPAGERTLGHTMVVIKLCQLHLSRLVQRLSEIYAWFSETSNADLMSWKKIKSWQRIWTLYAEQNGTYASFLKSIAALDLSITAMSKPAQNKAVSETLQNLLSLQDQLFDLTLDYARFLDTRKQPPVSFDELFATWEMIDTKLKEIERVTLERDEQIHPENVKGTKRKVIDIPR